MKWKRARTNQDPWRWTGIPFSHHHQCWWCRRPVEEVSKLHQRAIRIFNPNSEKLKEENQQKLKGLHASVLPYPSKGSPQAGACTSCPGAWHPTPIFKEKNIYHFSTCQIMCKFLLWPNWKPLSDRKSFLLQFKILLAGQIIKLTWGRLMRENQI